MTIYEQASSFVKMGIAVLPVGFKDKRPDFNLIKTWELYKTQLPSDQELKTWFSQGNHNYGIITGWNNLVVIDFDDADEYRAWSWWCFKTGGIAALVSKQAYKVATSRGIHVYIRLPHKERNRKAATKIDIKADGYVLGPGSVHPSGIQYRAMKEIYNFPIVQALSDVLPASFLVSTANQLGVSQNPAVWPIPQVKSTISGGLVEKIKKSFPIEGFFPDAKQSGSRYLLARCPLHDDHNPSMWIDTRDQICGCFAGCTVKPLDVINLVGRIHGLSNHDAIFYLGEKL